jgi:hypothetical protein
MRRSDSGPSSLSVDQRLREIAEILAAAVIRLQVRAALPGGAVDTENLPESLPNCLEVPRETRLSVHGS